MPLYVYALQRKILQEEVSCLARKAVSLRRLVYGYTCIQFAARVTGEDLYIFYKNSVLRKNLHRAPSRCVIIEAETEKTPETGALGRNL